MKTQTVILSIVLGFLPVAGRAENATPPLTAAVFDVQPADPALAAEAGNTTALLSTYLSTQDSLILVERQQLESVLGEQALGASGTVDAESAAKVGKLTGAKVILTSRMFLQGTSLMLVTKMIGTETGRVFADVATLPPGAAKNDQLRAFAEKLAGTIRQRGGELVARPESVDDRVARLRKLLAGRSLPSISVGIPEQHLTQRVIDPAAETEISSILGQLGFKLVTKTAPVPAEFQVTGEAVSERGVRCGDFISCRARVEVKLIEVATGRILLQDRQTEVGVDLAETIAAKNALQNAGAKLADRIVGAFAAAK